MSAAEIARALHGKPYGNGFLIRCPAVGHGKGNGDRNPSCTIRDGDIPGRLLVHCFAGCASETILDALRAANLLNHASFPEGGHPHLLHAEPRAEPPPDPEALRIWLAGRLVAGTIAETYLQQHRAITCPPPPSIRFGYTFHHVIRAVLPAMIAAITRPHDRKIVAVQCTFLTEQGRKMVLEPPRLTTGRMGTGAIRLAPCFDTLGIAEGCETALAAMTLTGIPCWSSVGAARLAQLTLPDTVRELHIFRDNDEPGLREATKAGQTYARQGRRVYIRTPPPNFKDYADVLLARAKAVAA